MARRSPPKLDAHDLKDSDKLSMTLGTLVEQDSRYRSHRRRIIRLQRQLRSLVSEEAWDLYLQLEEVSAARLARATELVAVWAFKQRGSR